MKPLPAWILWLELKNLKNQHFLLVISSSGIGVVIAVPATVVVATTVVVPATVVVAATVYCSSSSCVSSKIIVRIY